MVLDIPASHEGTSYILETPVFYSSIGSKYSPSQGPLSNVTVYANMVTEFELFYTETVPKTFGVLDVGASFYGQFQEKNHLINSSHRTGRCFRRGI